MIEITKNSESVQQESEKQIKNLKQEHENELVSVRRDLQEEVNLWESRYD